MPRAPRIQFENACYHIMARGNRQANIVIDDHDRELFSRTLGQACVRSGWEVFAWVLMNNHYHLVLRTPQANLVEGMQWFQNAYTRRFNARHRYWGHLFGGRYRSILIENQDHGSARWRDYLRTVIDYVHLNPARAGLVDGTSIGLDDYRWSSLAQGHLQSPGKRPKWLVSKTVLDLFGDKDSAAGRRSLLERYHSWIASESDEAKVDEVPFSKRLQRGWFWGSEHFREVLIERLPSDQTQVNRTYRSSTALKDHRESDAQAIFEEACKFFGKSPEELRHRKRGDWTRAAVAWAIWSKTLMPHAWIAEMMNLKSAANSSQQVRRFAAVPVKELPKDLGRWKKLKDVD